MSGFKLHKNKHISEYKTGTEYILEFKVKRECFVEHEMTLGELDKMLQGMKQRLIEDIKERIEEE